MTPRQVLYAKAAFVISLVATIGSLYFSNVALYAPCDLCWYQRIAIYPLLAIVGVGLIRHDNNLHFYALPLLMFGLIVSVYQNLLYYGIVAESTAVCGLGVSCAAKYIEWLGFITIPLLSLIGLITLTVLMFAFKKEGATK
ncbi:MAG: disulfide bond formation protein B [Candidatus Berkelbacteria bacterium]|nr:MAG: disulfide bond formation protein B [Candidatus Berkelbacteria bacterium]QQG51949.1 MAG: disulfide bond formation protein B [Candidatus Berkelbacteria bacterium]